MAAARGLGKGLDSLIPNAIGDSKKKTAGAEKSEIEKGPETIVKITKVEPNREQPRKNFDDEKLEELAASIERHGVIQPVVLRKLGIGYELVAGERRLRAEKRIGMREVPCVTVFADSEESAHMAIVENIQRENLNMFEQAEAMSSLMKIHCLTQEKIAEKLSCSQSYVANKLRLLRLPSEERDEILSAGLSERHARALLRIKGDEDRRSVLKTVVRREMNVAQTEEYIDRLIEAEKKEKAREKLEKRTRLIIKDVKILYNTIDKAIETVRLSGIDVQTLRRENSKDTEIVIRIPKLA